METLVTSSDISSAVTDFSMISLFLRADLVVKSVIVILIASSIWSWTIILSKLVKYKRLKQLENEFDEIFWSGNSFDDLYETFNHNQNDPKSIIFCSAMDEWKKSKRPSEEIIEPKPKFSSKNKLDYQERKRTHNRLAWIQKRFNIIEKEMERERSTIQDPIHVDDYEILQEAMENLTAFENEYLELMEEQDALHAKDMP